MTISQTTKDKIRTLEQEVNLRIFTVKINVPAGTNVAHDLLTILGESFDKLCTILKEDGND